MNRVLIVCFIFISSFCNAQIYIRLISENAKDTALFYKNNNFNPSQQDSLSVEKMLRTVVGSLQSQSFLEASVDTIVIKEKTWIVAIHLGRSYQWLHLINGNVENYLLRQTGFVDRIFDHTPFNYKEANQVLDRLLQSLENKGYPFAQVWLDSFQISDGSISAKIMARPGAFFKIAGIEMQGGTVKIAPSFLENYLDIKKGAIYSRQKILNISRRISELSYLDEQKKATVTFRGADAFIHTYLFPKKTNHWDFLIGVAPSTGSDGSQRFNITATGNADFQNLLGAGERITAALEQLRPQSPKLDVRLTYPYFFNLPVGADVRFNIYKQDSTFIETRFDLGALYLFDGGNYLKVFWNNFSSSNLTINENQIISSRQLPATLDVGANSFGLEFNSRRLDYLYNPRRGTSVFLRGSLGTRKVFKNPAIVQLKDPNDEAFEFSTLYDTVVQSAYQYKLESKIEQFLPFMQRGVFRLAFTGAYLSTLVPVAQNEQFRIGGSRLLRGFDEESIFATRYAVGSVDYRFIIGKNAYLYVFADKAYVENITRTVRIFDRPFGYGGGITFETPVGVFGVSLAVGSRDNQPIDFRNIKTHFGYTSLF